jgi:hypothetical protein
MELFFSQSGLYGYQKSQKYSLILVTKVFIEKHAKLGLSTKNFAPFNTHKVQIVKNGRPL